MEIKIVDMKTSGKDKFVNIVCFADMDKSGMINNDRVQTNE